MRFHRLNWSVIYLVSLLFFSGELFAQRSSSSHTSFSEPLFPINSSRLNRYFGQELHPRSSAENPSGSGTESSALPPRVRTHQEGILDVSSNTTTPARITVKAGFAQIVGNMEITTRRETNTRWVFRAENVDEEQNIWDEQGRAVLVPGKVQCQVSQRVSLIDYNQAGLTLTAGGTFPLGGVEYTTGHRVEQIKSDYIESEELCPIGDVAAFTTQKEIETRCKECLGKVFETIKQDVDSRINRLTYYVQAPGCTDDGQCYREDSAWLAGRCVLVKDKNNSNYSDCRARSSIGGACQGEGSRGLFEYKCDRGLTCTKVYASKGYWDYNRYECRDPQFPQFKGPVLPQDRESFLQAKTDLNAISAALTEFFKTHKRYPTAQEGLKVLALDKLKRDPFSLFGGSYLYLRKGHHYKLFSVGPDRKANTADDLIPAE